MPSHGKCLPTVVHVIGVSQPCEEKKEKQEQEQNKVYLDVMTGWWIYKCSRLVWSNVSLCQEEGGGEPWRIA
jgi:hypothetical protein